MERCGEKLRKTHDEGFFSELHKNRQNCWIVPPAGVRTILVGGVNEVIGTGSNYKGGGEISFIFGQGSCHHSSVTDDESDDD
jgi:hypothetical protein